MSTGNKINIIYRACEELVTPTMKSAVRPPWFNKKRCFKSLVDSVRRSNVDVDFYCVFDGEERELSEYIKNFTEVQYQPIKVFANLKSLVYCLNFSQELKVSSVYFVEDDYLHVPTAMNILSDGITRFGLVTGYDHTDRYTLEGLASDINKDRESLKLGKLCHWRTSESTTGTWAADKDCLAQVWETAMQHLKDGQDRNFFREIFNRFNRRLYTSLPGVSTHVAVDPVPAAPSRYLSPYVDWEALSSSVDLST